MKDKPFVSISCITYNHAPYIRQCLDGFIMQKTNFAFEVLIHDDASTDGTSEIIREYEIKYPDLIKPLYETENQYQKGVPIGSAVWNVPRAKGKYIALCEGDDYWTDPLKLQKQVDYMEDHLECGLCVTDFCFQNDLDKKSISQPAFSQGNLFKPQTFEEHLKNAGYIGPMTWMFRYSLLEQISHQNNNCTDVSFALSLDMFAISRVHYLPDVTAVYRVHQGSAANPTSVKQKFTYTYGVFHTQIEYAKKYNCDDKLIDDIKMQNYTTIMPLAIESNNQAFIDEALVYYRSKGLIMKWFVESCEEYVQYKNQYLQIRSSKAYKLGKMLLKPFKILRRK